MPCLESPVDQKAQDVASVFKLHLHVKSLCASVNGFLELLGDVKQCNGLPKCAAISAHGIESRVKQTLQLLHAKLSSLRLSPRSSAPHGCWWWWWWWVQVKRTARATNSVNSVQPIAANCHSRVLSTQPHVIVEPTRLLIETTTPFCNSG